METPEFGWAAGTHARRHRAGPSADDVTALTNPGDPLDFVRSSQMVMANGLIRKVQAAPVWN